MADDRFAIEFGMGQQEEQPPQEEPSSMFDVWLDNEEKEEQPAELEEEVSIFDSLLDDEPLLPSEPEIEAPRRDRRPAVTRDLDDGSPEDQSGIMVQPSSQESEQLQEPERQPPHISHMEQYLKELKEKKAAGQEAEANRSGLGALPRPISGFVEGAANQLWSLYDAEAVGRQGGLELTNTDDRGLLSDLGAGFGQMAVQTGLIYTTRSLATTGTVAGLAAAGVIGTAAAPAVLAVGTVAGLGAAAYSMYQGIKRSAYGVDQQVRDGYKDAYGVEAPQEVLDEAWERNMATAITGEFIDHALAFTGAGKIIKPSIQASKRLGAAGIKNANDLYRKLYTKNAADIAGKAKISMETLAKQFKTETMKEAAKGAGAGAISELIQGAGERAAVESAIRDDDFKGFLAELGDQVVSRDGLYDATIGGIVQGVGRGVTTGVGEGIKRRAMTRQGDADALNTDGSVPADAAGEFAGGPPGDQSGTTIQGEGYATPQQQREINDPTMRGLESFKHMVDDEYTMLDLKGDVIATTAAGLEDGGTVLMSPKLAPTKVIADALEGQTNLIVEGFASGHTRVTHNPSAPSKVETMIMDIENRKKGIANTIEKLNETIESSRKAQDQRREDLRHYEKLLESTKDKFDNLGANADPESSQSLIDDTGLFSKKIETLNKDIADAERPNSPLSKELDALYKQKDFEQRRLEALDLANRIESGDVKSKYQKQMDSLAKKRERVANQLASKEQELEGVKRARDSISDKRDALRKKIQHERQQVKDINEREGVSGLFTPEDARRKGAIPEKVSQLKGKDALSVKRLRELNEKFEKSKGLIDEARKKAQEEIRETEKKLTAFNIGEGGEDSLSPKEKRSYNALIKNLKKAKKSEANQDGKLRDLEGRVKERRDKLVDTRYETRDDIQALRVELQEIQEREASGKAFSLNDERKRDALIKRIGELEAQDQKAIQDIDSIDGDTGKLKQLKGEYDSLTDKQGDVEKSIRELQTKDVGSAKIKLEEMLSHIERLQLADDLGKLSKAMSVHAKNTKKRLGTNRPDVTSVEPPSFLKDGTLHETYTEKSFDETSREQYTNYLKESEAKGTAERVWDNAKDFYFGNFTQGGRMGKDGLRIVNVLNRSEGEKKAIIGEGQGLFRDLGKVATREELSSPQVTEALRGNEAAYNDLRNDMKPAINNLRAFVRKLADDLKAEGHIQGDLLASFDYNEGLYLHRSYKIFTTPGWVKEAVQNERLINQVVGLFKNKVQRLEGGETDKQLDSRMQGEIRSMLTEMSGENSILGAAANLKNANVAKYMDIMKERGKIPAPLRELMGESDNPYDVFTDTIRNMAAHLAQQKTLNEIVEVGNELGLFSENADASKNMTFKIDSMNGRMAPLGTAPEMWTTPEIGRAFEELFTPKVSGGLLAWMGTFSGITKVNATVLSPATQIVNFLGSPMTLLSSGTLWGMRAGDIKNVITVLGEIARNTPEGQEMVRRYQRLDVLSGLVTDQLASYGSDVKQVSKQFGQIGESLSGFANDSSVVQMGKKAYGALSELYMMGDASYKILQFEVELRRARERSDLKHLSTEKLEKWAAERTLKGQPDYKALPQIVKLATKFPYAAPFVSFSAAGFYMIKHNMSIATSEMRHPDAAVRRDAVVRLTSTLSAPMLVGWMADAINSTWGMSEEEDDSLRLLADSWDENGAIAQVGIDKDGNRSIVNLQRLNIYAPLSSAINALKRPSLTWEEAMGSALKETFSAFLNEDIFAQRINDSLRNSIGGTAGRKVYNPESPVWERTADILAHVSEPLYKPGAIKQIQRFSDSMHGLPDRRGNVTDPTSAAVGLVGPRPISMNIEQRIEGKGSWYSNAQRATTAELTDVLKSKAFVTDADIRSAYEKTKRLRGEIDKKMVRYVKAGRVQNLRDDQIFNAIATKGNVGKTKAAQLLWNDGKTPVRHPLGRETIKEIYQIENKSRQGTESRAEQIERVLGIPITMIGLEDD